MAQLEQADISAFSRNFKTPKVQQASLNVEREVAHRLAVGVSYMYVHGVDLIRARDENLPPPVNVAYPVYDATGTNFSGTYYDVDSFSTVQPTQTLTCPFPPCINPLARPIPQLGSINVFESAASSVYHGATLSIRRRMTSGVYFMLSTPLRTPSMTDRTRWSRDVPRRCRIPTRRIRRKAPALPISGNVLFSLSCWRPNLFIAITNGSGRFFNNWKASSVFTYGSGRPVSATVTGDANQDGNNSNDRLPGVSATRSSGPTTPLQTFDSLAVSMRATGSSWSLWQSHSTCSIATTGGFRSRRMAFRATRRSSFKQLRLLESISFPHSTGCPRPSCAPLTPTLRGRYNSP